MTGIGIVIIGGDDKNISAGAKKHGLSCCASNTPVVKYQKTLIVNAGTRVPWDLLPAAWNFLDRWDCAVPLWKYGVTANDIGTSDERKKTRDVIRDLRVLLYSHELLFIRKNQVGTEFIDIWNGEDGDRRLAFLRAYYTAKPVMCVLPTSWLAEIRAKSKTKTASGRHRRRVSQLVTVEVAPGKIVKCKPGDEARVRDAYKKMRGGRRGNR